MLEFTKRLQYHPHECAGITWGHHWTASKHCHIPEEGGIAPQNDPMDCTWGQDNLGRPSGTGMEQLNCCFRLSHRWTGKREVLLGEAVRRPLVVNDHLFFPPGHLSQKMQVGSPKVWGFFIRLQRFKNQYPEPNPLSEHRNSYQGGFRDKTITANCSKGYDKLQ